jgi:hypothetical protein
VFDLGVETASLMGHDMVGAGHILWALFSIEGKSKPFIRNWLEHNMGVTKEMIFATFENLTPNFKLIHVKKSNNV